LRPMKSEQLQLDIVNIAAENARQQRACKHKRTHDVPHPDPVIASETFCTVCGESLGIRLVYHGGGPFRV
jgi:hypothetical protein